MHLLFVAIVAALASLAGPAAAARYNCVPVTLAEEAKRLYVQCAEPSGYEGGLPKDGGAMLFAFTSPSGPDVVTTVATQYRIRYFSVRKSDADFSGRFADLVQTALLSGLVVQFIYQNGAFDSTIGCNIDDCRVPTAFGLLAARTDVRIPYAEWPSGSPESIAAGEWRRYGPFSISEFRKLVVTLSGTMDADLYVRKDDAPDAANYDCRPHLPTSNEQCVMAPPVADPQHPQTGRGTYYVGVRGNASGSFQLTVSIQDR